MMHDDVLRRVTELLSFNSYAVRKTSNNFSWQVLLFKQQTADGHQQDVGIVFGVRIQAFFTKDPTLLANQLSNFHTRL